MRGVRELCGIGSRRQGRRLLLCGLTVALLVILACRAEPPVEPPAPRARSGYSAVASRTLATVPRGSGEVTFPSDVPGYPGAAFFMGGTDEAQQRFVSLLSRATYTDVYTYYRRALLALGWDIEQDAQRGRSFVLVARKRGRFLSVRVEPSRNGSEIALETGPPRRNDS